MDGDHDPAPTRPSFFSASEKVVWLFPLRPPQWRGEVWARVEDIFARSAERLFRSQSAFMAAEEALAAARERLHR